MNILDKRLGRKLLASAAFWIAQAIFVSLLYAGAGSVFAALSDLSNALAVALMAPLIWALYRLAASRYMSFSLIGLLIAMLGVLISAGASFAIFFGWIGFNQSLPPVIGGLGLAGLGMLILFQLLRYEKRLPVWARKWGRMMSAGLAAILGLFAFGHPALWWSGSAGLALNPLIFVVLLPILIGYFAYPIWTIKYGRELLKEVRE